MTLIFLVWVLLFTGTYFSAWGNIDGHYLHNSVIDSNLNCYPETIKINIYRLKTICVMHIFLRDEVLLFATVLIHIPCDGLLLLWFTWSIDSHDPLIYTIFWLHFVEVVLQSLWFGRRLRAIHLNVTVYRKTMRNITILQV